MDRISILAFTPESSASVELRIALVGKPETTMKLDRAIGGKGQRGTCLGFSHTDRDLALHARPKGMRRRIDVRPGLLHPNMRIDRRMLERLIGTDQTTELLAGIQIGNRIRHTAITRAAHICCRQKTSRKLDLS